MRSGHAWAVAVAVVGVGAVSASASVVGYWTFEDGAPTDTASAVASSINSPILDGTASGNSGGPAPYFSAEVPGAIIIDGLGGSTLNAANDASLRFVNTGGADSKTGGIVTIPDSASLTRPASFTVELFVKVDIDVNYATLFCKSRADSGGSSWMMDINGNGTLRARYDTQVLGTGGSGTTGFNQNFTTTSNLQDGAWHHVAMTYDGTTRAVALYCDYSYAGGDTANLDLVYDGQPIYIGDQGGGRAFDGWIDEPRLSDSVLTTDEFLRAVPEPASMASMALAVAVLWGIRRRRQPL